MSRALRPDSVKDAIKFFTVADPSILGEFSLLHCQGLCPLTSYLHPGHLLIQLLWNGEIINSNIIFQVAAYRPCWLLNSMCARQTEIHKEAVEETLKSGSSLLRNDLTHP